jgi:flagellar basal-body rod protein FlgB
VDEQVLFDQTLNTAASALDLRSRRHEMTISNLANADTPGYKAFDLLVEKAMADQKSAGASVQLERTHTGHMKMPEGHHGGLTSYTIQTQNKNSLRGDGNTVDMDREMSNLASNQLLYKVSAQIVSKKFQGLKYIIQGGNK